MGSCCINIKSSMTVQTGTLNKPNAKTIVDNLKINSKSLEDLEIVPETRKILRGSQALTVEVAEQEKSLTILGTDDKLFFLKMGLTFSCKKGLKSTSFNQDDFSIIFENKVLLLSVFDGHGYYGSEISNYLHIMLPKMILSHPKFPEEIELIISESFFKCNTLLHQYCEDSGISSELSGSTCTVLLVKNNIVYAGNIGDSRAVHCDACGKSSRITVDHKVSNPAEAKRIESSGGQIRKFNNESCSRIFAKDKKLPGISISRAFGDSLAQSIGVSVEPDIYKKVIEQDDKYIILSSDGVWEFIQDQQAIDLIQDSENPAKVLSEVSWKKWIEQEGDAVDDITVIVLNLQEFYKYLSNI